MLPQDDLAGRMHAVLKQLGMRLYPYLSYLCHSDVIGSDCNTYCIEVHVQAMKASEEIRERPSRLLSLGGTALSSCPQEVIFSMQTIGITSSCRQGTCRYTMY